MADRRAIEVLGEALKGTDRPMLVTSGFTGLASGKIAIEADKAIEDSPYPRRSEIAARALAAQGVKVATVRLASSVHGVGETHGFMPILINIARQEGVSAYVGDSANRWPAVHVADAARVYRLALESGATEPTYHAVSESGIPFHDIAKTIGRKLGLPVESREMEHFDWFGRFASGDDPVSSKHTRSVLDWKPAHPGLLADILDPLYYSAD